MPEQVISILTFLLLIGYVIVDKVVIPKVDDSTVKAATDAVTTTISITQKLDVVLKMAKQFVILAKKEMADSTGEEKRDWVIKKLKTICDGLDFVLDDDSLKAINEGAYSDMKKDEVSNTTK